MDFQNRFKRSWDLLLLKKNTLLPVSYHSYTTTYRFQTYQAQQTSLHHSYTQQLKAHAPQTNEWAKQHALRNKTARTIKGFLDLSHDLQCSVPMHTFYVEDYYLRALFRQSQQMPLSHFQSVLGNPSPLDPNLSTFSFSMSFFLFFSFSSICFCTISLFLSQFLSGQSDQFRVSQSIGS